MNIPNGLTLSLQNTRHVTRKIGNTVLNDRQIELVHIRTVKELIEALRLQRANEIRIFTEIPDEVMDLVDLPESDEETPDDTPPPTNYVYQDQLVAFKQEMLGLIGAGVKYGRVSGEQTDSSVQVEGFETPLPFLDSDSYMDSETHYEVGDEVIIVNGTVIGRFSREG